MDPISQQSPAKAALHPMSTVTESLQLSIDAAREKLDAHTVETVHWHFSESTGSPFWLEKKAELNFDPLTEIKSFEDLKKFPLFEDDWLRGGPVRRWIPKGLADKPAYVFETGGTTGTPKSRVVMEDHWIDYGNASGRIFSTRIKLVDVGAKWSASTAIGG
jgi:phenylacetate-coenzyme A ligase PaaK-like adenylate-forming protein